MTLCKVLLYGLKPCDMIISTKENEPEPLTVDNASVKDAKKDVDYLNLDIKPLVSPTNSRTSTSSTTTSEHEASPIRVMIRETTRGRHRICISQTLFRSHAGEV